MDKQLINTKHFDLYLSTLEFGVGINYVPDYKTLHIKLLVLEFIFHFGYKVTF